jgi:pantothenate kinase-related protein Tda10
MGNRTSHGLQPMRSDELPRGAGFIAARRRTLLHRLAQDVLALPSDRPRIVAVDGADGAGKTILADELATLLGAAG